MKRIEHCKKKKSERRRKNIVGQEASGGSNNKLNWSCKRQQNREKEDEEKVKGKEVGVGVDLGMSFLELFFLEQISFIFSAFSLVYIQKEGNEDGRLSLSFLDTYFERFGRIENIQFIFWQPVVATCLYNSCVPHQ